MKRQILMVLLVNLMAAGSDMTRAASDTGPLRLIQTVPLPGVEGRIDHLAVDVVVKSEGEVPFCDIVARRQAGASDEG